MKTIWHVFIFLPEHKTVLKYDAKINVCLYLFYVKYHILLSLTLPLLLFIKESQQRWLRLVKPLYWRNEEFTDLKSYCADWHSWSCGNGRSERLHLDWTHSLPLQEALRTTTHTAGTHTTDSVIYYHEKRQQGDQKWSEKASERSFWLIIVESDSDSVCCVIYSTTHL